MNITYIFGNGFDLQAGLHTRYSDFLEEYVRAYPGDSSNLRRFKRELLDGQNEKGWWSDAEAAMGRHLKEYDDKSVSDYIERIRDFEGKLTGYLDRQQDQCTFDNSSDITWMFLDFIHSSFDDFLCGKAVSTNTPADNRYNLITFNYTTILESILQCCTGSPEGGFLSRSSSGGQALDRIGPVCHVHGSLDTSIVMGVDNDSQLDVSGGVTITPELRWKIIKPDMNESSDLTGAEEAERIIEGSEIIAIYGVSFGETDRRWWEKILQWLEVDREHILVLFTRSEGESFNKAVTWVRIERNRQLCGQMLEKLIGTRDQERIERLLSQVRIILDTERLTMKPLLHRRASMAR